MKHFVKGDEPPFYQIWRKKKPHANWDDFSGTETYIELRKVLIKEQANLCCYCELALTKDVDAHIEHHRPKSERRQMFIIENLFACCQHKDSCGHHKGSTYFNGFISPLDKNCQDRFTYTGTGKIIPVDETDELAQKTIDTLELNCKRLKTQRESIIKMLENIGMTTHDLQESLDNCVEWYHGFYTVIQYIADKFAKYASMESTTSGETCTVALS
jgi:uncharacterized protein (TIGR02646 family)